MTRSNLRKEVYFSLWFQRCLSVMVDKAWHASRDRKLSGYIFIHTQKERERDRDRDTERKTETETKRQIRR